MKKLCLALDLNNNPELIAEYDAYHKNVWPEILESIYAAGINNMEIYRFSNRLFMIMETNDDFSFEHKTDLDAHNTKVQEWENLMWKYQQALPGTPEGAKWVVLDKIFQL